MTFLISFNRYLLVPLLSEWLSIEEFGLLDSALCSGRPRQVILGLVADFHEVFGRQFSCPLSELPLSIKILEWFATRKVNSWIGNCILTNALLCELAEAGDHRVADLSSRLSSITLKNLDSSHGSLCCSYLREMTSLQSCTIANCDDSAALLKSISSVQMRRLSLSNCSDLRNEDIRQFILKNAALREISVNYCSLEGTFSLSTADDLLDVVQHVPEDAVLLSLLNAPRFKRYDARRVSDDTLRHLTLNSCATLTTLRIASSDSISDVVMIDLIKSCSLLTDIDVSACFEITDDFVLAVATHLPLLTTINLSDLESLTSVSLNALFELEHLEVVSLWHSMRDGKVFNFSYCLPHLRHLTIDESTVSPDVLGNILQHCPSLTHLRLQSNIALKNRGRFLRGLYLCGWQLTSLHLQNSYGFSDGHMEALFPHCPNLTDVDIGNCTYLTERSLLAAVQNCQLRSLNCQSHFFEVSSATVNVIIETQARTLRVLQLFHCVMAINDSLLLRRGLSRLTKLSVLRQHIDCR